jgi:HK97 family phage portal protein
MQTLGLDRLTGTVFSLQTKAAAPPLQPLSTRGAWWPWIRESFTGAWQRNVTIDTSTVLTFSAVYACVSLIASDISKNRVKLVEQTTDGIWEENERTEKSPFGAVLRKPNRYQNRVKFFEWWMVSKLINGNAYALKQREPARKIVTALYLLDPTRVTPLVAEDGSIYYQLQRDPLSSLPQDMVVVPASEIIHDVMCPLYHPLIGVSPIHACGLAAMQGLKIQNNSYKFFSNGSQPGGIITAPPGIKQSQAEAIVEAFATNFTGDNFGKVGLLADGMKYEGIKLSNVDAQLIEQLHWTSETVCSAFHVPPYKIGIGPAPSYNNIQSLNVEYYSQALQNPIETLELSLDEGLELPRELGTEFDLDNLLRMDTATLIASENQAQGIKKPNESRKRLNLPPVTGGDDVYRQQQEFSLAALHRRDETTGVPNSQPISGRVGTPPAEDDEDEDELDMAASFGDALHRKMIEAELYAA